jgi:hypothetical protein
VVKYDLSVVEHWLLIHEGERNVKVVFYLHVDVTEQFQLWAKGMFHRHFIIIF